MIGQLSIEHQAYRMFPECHVSTQFEAALPLYHLPIVTRVIEYQDISTVTWYLLKTVSLGVNTLPAISQLLGLSEAELAIPGAEALRSHLIQYGEPNVDFTRPLVLTSLGWEVLRESKKQPVPRQKTIHLHFSPLTGELSALESEVRDNRVVRDQGLYVLPQRLNCPSLQDLDLTEARSAYAGESRSGGFDIIGLTELRTPWIEYQTVDCLLLRNSQTVETRLAVFRRLLYLESVSTHLQRMHQQGIAVLPQDAQETLDESTGIRSSLPEPVSRTLEVARQNEGTLSNLRRELREREAQRSATQLESEREDLLGQISQLRVQIDAVCAERDEAISTAASQNVQILSVLEHRPFLERAIDAARSELIVLSPWMTSRAVDRDLIRRIRAALERGVTVWIGYGLKSNRPDEEDRIRKRSARVIGDLKRGVAGAESNLRIVDLGAIHEKILVCDREFGVVTSFNWLSYRGDDDSGLKTETGVVLRTPSFVDSVATTKLRELSTGVRQ